MKSGTKISVSIGCDLGDILGLFLNTTGKGDATMRAGTDCLLLLLSPLSLGLSEFRLPREVSSAIFSRMVYSD